jgi:hypothetical protein
MSSDNFRKDVEAFLKRHSLSATRFGVLAAGDTKFVKTLRAGRKVRPQTEAAIRGWMKEQGEP